MTKLTEKNRLTASYPQIAAQWHPTLNGELTAYDISYGSGKMIWWKCPKGHEWQASVNNRTNHNNGCPYCSGRRPIKGKTDFATLRPEIAEEWDYIKNGDKTPDMFTVTSGEKVWWRCEKGHEWQATIDHRTGRQDQCPYCSGRRVVVGETDLATVAPEIAKEWNYAKNAETPQMLTSGSPKRVWWICPKGHEWQTSINNRVKQKSQCPYCAGKYSIIGETDLPTIAPDIAKEWNHVKNGALTPEMFTKGSVKRVWWICKFGHEWQTAIYDRVHNKTGCPYCAGQRPVKGENDLATLFPELVKEWNYQKNSGKTPEMFMPATKKKVWWVCPKGHEWKCPISARTQKDSGCPYCYGKLPLVGETDLATLMPEIAEEWNYTKNGNKTPEMYTKHSGKKVWWICPKGHEWRTSIDNRTHTGSGCPI